MWVLTLLPVMLLAGCRLPAVPPARGEASPAWRRASTLWRIHHRSLVRTLGRGPKPDRLRFREAHEALLEQLVVLKHLDAFRRARGWDRILESYRDLFTRARGGVSPRVLELRYFALGRAVEARIEGESLS